MGDRGWLTGHLVSGGSSKVEGFPQAAETWQAPKYSDNKEELSLGA